ncbi:MAG: hypothetical protein ACHP7K_11310 [Actinomycetales bacterium]
MRIPQLSRRTFHWTSDLARRPHAPALVVTGAVAAFWIAALVGGLQLLSAPRSAVVTLGWLYFMLLMIAGTGLYGVLAVRYLARCARGRSLQRIPGHGRGVTES